MSSLDQTFDYCEFIEEGFASQSKYAKKAGDNLTPDDLRHIDTLIEIGGDEIRETFREALQFRYKKIIEHFGHLAEESIEARVYVPRRSWKNNEPSYLDDPEKRKEFVAELFDILLFHRAILAYAGVSGQEFLEVAREKSAYNQVRKDHNVNGSEEASRNPAAELQGDCASASFSSPEEEEAFNAMNSVTYGS